MVSVQSMKTMCEAPAEGKAYYRPIICKGKIGNVLAKFVHFVILY